MSAPWLGQGAGCGVPPPCAKFKGDGDQSHAVGAVVGCWRYQGSCPTSLPALQPALPLWGEPHLRGFVIPAPPYMALLNAPSLPQGLGAARPHLPAQGCGGSGPVGIMGWQEGGSSNLRARPCNPRASLGHQPVDVSSRVQACRLVGRGPVSSQGTLQHVCNPLQGATKTPHLPHW